MASEGDRAFVQRALAGEEAEVRRLLDRLTPVVQSRVARCLLRSGRAGPRLRQELKDLVQDVFLTLFEGGGKVLASWDAARGLSLDNFVGLVTERQVISILRSGRRTAWKEDPTLDEEMERPASEAGPEAALASREALETLLSRLREALSPQGWQLFDLLYLKERSVAEVEQETGLSPDAVYAWRSRLRRLARSLLDDPLSGTALQERRPR